jgi:hypothetical protein
LALTAEQSGAVPILTRLEAFNLTKTADCSSIASAEPRQTTVRKSVTLIAELLRTWHVAATLIVMRKLNEELLSNTLSSILDRFVGQRYPFFVHLSYAGPPAIRGVKHGSIKSIFLWQRFCF